MICRTLSESETPAEGTTVVEFVVECDSSASSSKSSPKSGEDAENPGHPISGRTLRNGQI